MARLAFAEAHFRFTWAVFAVSLGEARESAAYWSNGGGFTWVTACGSVSTNAITIRFTGMLKNDTQQHGPADNRYCRLDYLEVIKIPLMAYAQEAIDNLL